MATDTRWEVIVEDRPPCPVPVADGCVAGPSGTYAIVGPTIDPGGARRVIAQGIRSATDAAIMAQAPQLASALQRVRRALAACVAMSADAQHLKVVADAEVAALLADLASCIEPGADAAAGEGASESLHIHPIELS